MLEIQLSYNCHLLPKYKKHFFPYPPKVHHRQWQDHNTRGIIGCSTLCFIRHPRILLMLHNILVFNKKFEQAKELNKIALLEFQNFENLSDLMKDAYNKKSEALDKFFYFFCYSIFLSLHQYFSKQFSKACNYEFLIHKMHQVLYRFFLSIGRHFPSQNMNLQTYLLALLKNTIKYSLIHLRQDFEFSDDELYYSHQSILDACDEAETLKKIENPLEYLA